MHMKSIGRTTAIAIVAAFAGCSEAAPEKAAPAAPAAADSQALAPENIVIATNGVPVLTRADLEARLNAEIANNIPPDAQIPPAEMMRIRAQIADDIIGKTRDGLLGPILFNAAKQNGFGIDEKDTAELEKSYDAQKGSMPGAPATFAEFKAARPDIYERIERDYTINKFIKSNIAGKTAPVTEKDATDYIMFLQSQGFLDNDAALAKIKGLKARIDAGEDFAAIAMVESDCPSRSKGGDLGQFARGQMLPEFDKAAFELPVGVVSEPVRTKYGWHIIKVAERAPAAEAKDGQPAKPESARASHILVGVKVPDIPEAIKAIEQERRAEAVQEFLYSFAQQNQITMPAIDAARAKIKELQEKQKQAG